MHGFSPIVRHLAQRSNEAMRCPRHVLRGSSTRRKCRWHLPCAVIYSRAASERVLPASGCLTYHSPFRSTNSFCHSLRGGTYPRGPRYSLQFRVSVRQTYAKTQDWSHHSTRLVRTRQSTLGGMWPARIIKWHAQAGRRIFRSFLLTLVRFGLIQQHRSTTRRRDGRR